MEFWFDDELHVSQENQVRADDEGKSHRVNDTHMEAF